MKPTFKTDITSVIIGSMSAAFFVSKHADDCESDAKETICDALNAAHNEFTNMCDAACSAISETIYNPFNLPEGTDVLGNEIS